MSAQPTGTGRTVILFCCMEFVQGGAGSSVGASDSFVVAPTTGVYDIDTIVPIYAGVSSAAAPSTFGTITVEAFDGFDNLLAVIATGIIPHPYGTVTLATAYPLPAGTRVRVFIDHSNSDGITVHETATVALTWHKGNPPIMVCAPPGGGGNG